MTSTPASALCSSMKAFPLVLIVMAVLSVSGKATSVQNDPDRESAYREYRGDTADEDNVARPLDSIGGHENKQEDTQRLQDILERSEEQRLQNWRQYFAHANRDRLGRLHSFGRTLDSTGGGGRQLLRDLDGLPHFPRRTRSGLDSLSGVTFGWNKRLDSLSGITFGNQKRNFDEIDRSGFNGFVKKNFDEIDRSGFDGFVKKNFDEIDRVGFGSFVKRNAPQLLARSYDKDNH